MRLLSNQNLAELLQNQYLLLDSDFISKLFQDPEFLADFGEVSKNSSLMLDTMVAFEFLRDVFDPRIRKLKENFLDSDRFWPVVNHQEIYTKVQEQALLLSKIYAHNGKSAGVGVVDLFLAARMVVSPINTLLITGNKKHYPSCVFDIKIVLNVEDPGSESVRCFSVLSLNRENLRKCNENLLKAERTD